MRPLDDRRATLGSAEHVRAGVERIGEDDLHASVVWWRPLHVACSLDLALTAARPARGAATASLGGCWPVGPDCAAGRAFGVDPKTRSSHRHRDIKLFPILPARDESE